MYITANMCCASAVILRIFIFLLGGVPPAHSLSVKSNLEIVKQWKLFSFDFPPHAPVSDTSYYNPLNVVPTSMTVAYDRIFIATPKLFAGVPSTLSYVSTEDYNESPLLKAYPDWSYTVSGRTDFMCSDPYLISVYRLRIDSCNRMWILDTAISRSFEDSEQTCGPKILVVDLSTDQVVKRIDIPKDVLRDQSLLTNLIVDETTSSSGTCDDVFVYITDTVKPAIIVYDGVRDMVWRLSHPSMWPDPDLGLLRVLNDRFIVMDGIIGFAFDAVNGIVYFQPLATDRIFSITKEVLRAGPRRMNDILPVNLLGKKSSQGLALLVAPQDGSLLFSPLTETAIVTWHPQTQKQTVLLYDADALQFVADISNSPWEKDAVFAMSSKFQRFLLQTVDSHEINFRLIRIKYPNKNAVSAQILFTPATHVNNDLYSNGLRLNALNGTTYTNVDVRPMGTSSHAYNLGSTTKVFHLRGIQNGVQAYVDNVPAAANVWPIANGGYHYDLGYNGP